MKSYMKSCNVTYIEFIVFVWPCTDVRCGGDLGACLVSWSEVQAQEAADCVAVGAHRAMRAWEDSEVHR